MQFADDAGVGGGGSASEAGTLPPQAQTGLPAMAGDLADIAPAPSPEVPLLQAAYGDRGAEQYAALRDAGRATGAPPPIAQPTTLATRPGGAIETAAQAFGTDRDWMMIQEQQVRQQQLALQQQAEYRRNAAEFYGDLMPKLFKAYPGRPEVAAALLAHQAQARGLQVDPTVLIAQNQDIQDGKMTYEEMSRTIADPKTPVSTIQRIGMTVKFIDDLAKGHAEAREAVTKAQYADQREREGLRGAKLANDMKQMDVDTFYDSVEKRISAEATKNGLTPGTRQYSDYVENRKRQIEAETKRTALAQTPLSGKEEEDFLMADRAGKFATEASKLLNDPNISKDRGVVEGRLRNLAWRLGFAQSEKEDLYQSFSNISGLMASKVYSGGIRNMKWIDRVLEHTLKPGDETSLLKDKVNVLLRAAREQQQGILNIHGRAASTLEPTVPAVALPGEGEGAGAGGLSAAGADYLKSLGGSGAPPPTP